MTLPLFLRQLAFKGMRMLGPFKRRLLVMFAAMAALMGCQPDTEAEVRALANRWVFLAQTLHFNAQSDCSVAKFEVVSDLPRQMNGPKIVTSVRSAIPVLQEGQAVVFDIPGMSPNAISEKLMSINLFEGLALLSSFVGPGRRCMDDQYSAEAFTALMSTETLLIFDPVSYSMVLLYRPAPVAFYMRTGT